MRDGDFVEKQGNPVVGGLAVGVRAAEEFDFAVEFFDEARVAEGGDGFAFIPDEPSGSVQFHASILAGGIGQRRGEGPGKGEMKNGARNAGRGANIQHPTPNVQ